ncbi:unnamed protein product [Ilex paraguariensis]|uniref:Uncharacterized protein n=1 Tax=Ilex paraguariensis TaxID=185542 RepID=A0ABC8TVF6_9AQUA
MSLILLGHTSFVGPLAWVSLKEEFPEGGIVSGGMDTHALVSDLAIGEKVQSLKGHQVQVTGIALDGLDIATSSIAWQWTKKDRVDHTRVHHFVTLSLTVSIKLSPVVHQPLELVAEVHSP